MSVCPKCLMKITEEQMAEIIIIDGSKMLQHVDCLDVSGGRYPSPPKAAKAVAYPTNVKMKTIEFSVMIDDDENYILVDEGDDAEDRWSEEVDSFSETRHTYAISFKVPVPTARHIEIEAQPRRGAEVEVKITEK